ncbi:MAG TPA: murein biosynthesis integral membrane protein MurJ [Acidimicrobiales bacterium]|jgi:putative peptidoglycan lipid II flippase|nr:murein biosynthesis integral membrane protein MurJ [Acidimicrobiales bacterium]
MPILSDGILADPQQVSRPASPGRATQRPQQREPGEKPVPAKRSSNLVAAGILLSRLSGLVREMVVTGYLGVSIAADAFKAALMIPNFLQNLLGEGVLSASFIPVYARLRSEGEEEEAGRLAGAVAGMLIVLTGVTSVIGVTFAGQITHVIVPGFSGQRYDTTVDLVRIMFPGVGLLVLSAWCLGVLNSHRKFFLSYVAPVVWNVAQIAAAVAVGISTSNKHSIAVALAWGVLAGGALQLGVQLVPVHGLLGSFRFSLDVGRESVRAVRKRFAPVVLGRGVVQIMGYVDLTLASFLAAGSVSAFNFSQVLYILPISVFAMSVAAAELPDLSEVDVHDADTRRAFRRRLEEGMARIMYYVGPTATIFVVAGDVVVRLAYQRGSFGPDDTWAVWLVLAAFSFGLPAATSSRLLQNGLYALGDTKTPARLAAIRVLIAAVLGLAFMFPFDRLTVSAHGIQGWHNMLALGPLPEAVRNSGTTPHLGIVALAIGASVAAWIEYIALSRALAWRIGRTRLAGRWLNPISAGCACAALVAWAAIGVVPELPSVVTAFLTLAPAGLAYLAVTRILKVPEALDLTRRIDVLTSRVRRG